MKRPNLILLFIGILLLIPMSIGIVRWIEYDQTKVVDSYTYEGKILMNATEYAEFKKIIARYDIDIVYLEVYSSDNPLVIFEVRTPSEIQSFWGERTDRGYRYTATKSEQNLYCGWLTCGCGVLAISLLITSFTIKYYFV